MVKDTERLADVAGVHNGTTEKDWCPKFVAKFKKINERSEPDNTPATYEEIKENLTILINDLTTREAAEALGWSPKSWGSLKGLLEDYEIEVPNRLNQHDPESSEPEDYASSVELCSDGSYKSDKLLNMSMEQAKDKAYLLAAHGFDDKEWEIVTAKNSIWNVYSKGEDGHEVSTLYSSKITVKPLKDRFDIVEIVAALNKVEPVTIKAMAFEPNPRMLELSLYDMHFGHSTLHYYSGVLEDVVHIIDEYYRDEVVIPIGSDLFHNDNFRNTTASGTVVDTMDFTAAWADAATFYSTVIQTALECCKRVIIIYVKGNHDESMSWAFCQMLAAKYPQVEFDFDIQERKVHVYRNVCVGFTHKASKDSDRAFISEFPFFASAQIKEIHAGHYHHEVVKDQFGIVVRALSTGNKTDQWHKDNGFVGANKRFQIFEYTPDALSSIRYV